MKNLVVICTVIYGTTYYVSQVKMKRYTCSVLRVSLKKSKALILDGSRAREYLSKMGIGYWIVELKTPIFKKNL